MVSSVRNASALWYVHCGICTMVYVSKETYYSVKRDLYVLWYMYYGIWYVYCVKEREALLLPPKEAGAAPSPFSYIHYL